MCLPGPIALTLVLALALALERQGYFASGVKNKLNAPQALWGNATLQSSMTEREGSEFRSFL